MPLKRRQFSAALAATVASAAARSEFRVEISGIGGTQLPLAVVRFRDEGRGDAATSAIVRADLERSGVFRIVDSNGGLDERAVPQYSDWRSRGADALGTATDWPNDSSPLTTSQSL